LSLHLSEYKLVKVGLTNDDIFVIPVENLQGQITSFSGLTQLRGNSECKFSNTIRLETMLHRISKQQINNTEIIIVYVTNTYNNNTDEHLSMLEHIDYVTISYKKFN